MVAASEGSRNHTAIVGSLLRHKAGAGLTDNNNRTALDIAQEKGHRDIINRLKNHAAAGQHIQNIHFGSGNRFDRVTNNQNGN